MKMRHSRRLHVLDESQSPGRIISRSRIHPKRVPATCRRNLPKSCSTSVTKSGANNGIPASWSLTLRPSGKLLSLALHANPPDPLRFHIRERSSIPLPGPGVPGASSFERTIRTPPFASVNCQDESAADRTHRWMGKMKLVAQTLAVTRQSAHIQDGNRRNRIAPPNVNLKSQVGGARRRCAYSTNFMDLSCERSAPKPTESQ